MEIDIVKADPFPRQLVLDILATFHFPERIYLNTPKFSISINGALHGYFHGDKGLRLSPWSFYFSHRIPFEDPTFYISAKCQDLGITHLFG